MTNDLERDRILNYHKEDAVKLKDAEVGAKDLRTVGVGSREVWKFAMEIYGIDDSAQPLVMEKITDLVMRRRFSTNQPDIYADIYTLSDDAGDGQVTARSLVKLGSEANALFREEMGKKLSD